MATTDIVQHTPEYRLRTTCGSCAHVTIADLSGASCYGSDADFCAKCGGMFATDSASEAFVEGEWRKTWWDNETGGLVYEGAA